MGKIIRFCADLEKSGNIREVSKATRAELVSMVEPLRRKGWQIVFYGRRKVGADYKNQLTLF